MRLAPEPLDLPRARRDLGVEELHGDRAPDADVLRAPDLAHAALAEQLLEPVAAVEHAPRREAARSRRPAAGGAVLERGRLGHPCGWVERGGVETTLLDGAGDRKPQEEGTRRGAGRGSSGASRGPEAASGLGGVGD